MNAWLLEHAGNLLRAESPELVLGEPLAWRVDVVLTSPRRGTVGWVGRLAMNARTGEVLANDTTAAEIAARADTLMASAPPSPQAGREVLHLAGTINPDDLATMRQVADEACE